MDVPHTFFGTAPAARQNTNTAVTSMILGAFALATAEFLPPGLLTPMASNLDISLGLAGQSVTATAVLASLGSLLVPSLTRRLDRRHVLLGLSTLLVAANLLVACASGITLLLLGRAVLGVAIGGFWVIAAGIIMQLLPGLRAPRALPIAASGLGIASILAAPVGSWLGALLGWREVFVLAAALGTLALLAQWLSVPRMAPPVRTDRYALAPVLRRPHMASGLTALLLIVAGNAAMFTYIRPFLENITAVTITGVGTTLLAFGAANYIGSRLGGQMLDGDPKLTMTLMPLSIGIVGIVLAGTLGTPFTTLALVAIWGLAFGTVPVAWSIWMARTVPDAMDSGSTWVLATLQLGIAVGAVVGGVMLDTDGITSVFDVGGLILLLTTACIWLALKQRTRARPAKATVRRERTSPTACDRGRVTGRAHVHGGQPPARACGQHGRLCHNH